MSLKSAADTSRFPTKRLVSPAPPSRVARLVLQLRDALGTLYTDADFADLFPMRGQPAEVPWRLALVTVLQFLEGLSDRQAADAVRSRLDWKYARSLELTDPGFDHTVLSEFRARLVQGTRRSGYSTVLLEQCASARLAQSPGAPADRCHACAGHGACPQPVGVRGRDAAPCAECASGGGSGVAAQAYVEREHAEWVSAIAAASRSIVCRPALSLAGLTQKSWGRWLGLLRALEETTAPAWLRELPALQSLQRVWAQQYQPREAGGHWRQPRSCPPLGRSRTRPTTRTRARQETGDHLGRLKGHLTETCDPDRPHLLVSGH